LYLEVEFSKKNSLKGTIPELTNIKVGSFLTTIEDEELTW
jgi:hypothetical protein